VSTFASQLLGWQIQICAARGFAMSAASTGDVITATTSDPCKTMKSIVRLFAAYNCALAREHTATTLQLRLH
jgi:hypothetical protein